MRCWVPYRSDLRFPVSVVFGNLRREVLSGIYTTDSIAPNAIGRFDAIWRHIAGAARGPFNERFGRSPWRCVQGRRVSFFRFEACTDHTRRWTPGIARTSAPRFLPNTPVGVVWRAVKILGSQAYDRRGTRDPTLQISPDLPLAGPRTSKTAFHDSPTPIDRSAGKRFPGEGMLGGVSNLPSSEHPMPQANVSGAPPLVAPVAQALPHRPPARPGLSYNTRSRSKASSHHPLGCRT